MHIFTPELTAQFENMGIDALVIGLIILSTCVVAYFVKMTLQNLFSKF